MSKCNECSSSKLISVIGKCNDRCITIYNDKEYKGYVPDDMNIGGGDYMEFTYCAHCGKIQGDFPISDENIDKYSNRD
jgi:hypothetical protein